MREDSFWDSPERCDRMDALKPWTNGKFHSEHEHEDYRDSFVGMVARDSWGCLFRPERGVVMRELVK